MSSTILEVPSGYLPQNPMLTSAASTNVFIRLTAPTAPTSFLGAFPITYMTLIGGGWRSVGSLDERNAIPSGYRIEGMRVWVKENGNEYQLASDLTTWNVISTPLTNPQYFNGDYGGMAPAFSPAASAATADDIGVLGVGNHWIWNGTVWGPPF